MATMSTVWDRAAEFLSDNLAVVAPIALLTLFVPLSLSGNLSPLTGTLGPAGNVALGLVLMLLALVNMWGHLAITALALDPAAGPGEAVAAANARLLPLVGLSLILLIGTLVLALPFLVALGMSGLDMSALAAGHGSWGSASPGALLIGALYVPLFAALLLWLSARLAVVTPAMLMERRGLGVFARSFALTQRAQWKIVGVLILYMVVLLVATTATRAVFESVLGLLIGGEGPITLASVLTSTVVAGISTIFSLLAIAFVARLYLATRDARESIVDGAVVNGAGVNGAVVKEPVKRA